MARRALAEGKWHINTARRMGDDHLRVSYYVHRVGQERTDKPRYVTRPINPRIREGSPAWKREAQEATEEAERRARRLVEESRAQAEEAATGRRVWRADDSLCEYVREVVLPAIEGDEDIRESSRARYRYAIRHLDEVCEGLSIRQALAKRSLVEEIQEVARKHGASSATRLRSVMRTYVIQSLMIDEVIGSDPLRGLTIKYHHDASTNHGNTRRSVAVREGRIAPGDVPVVSPGERRRVIEWLLADDPEAYAAHGRHGGVTQEQCARGRRCLIDMCLVQATCGMRIHEMLTLTARHVTWTDDGIAVLEVTQANSKTGCGRKVVVIDPVWRYEVSARVRQRLVGLAPDDHVFYACKTVGSEWDYRNAHKRVRRLYDEMADMLDIPVLHDVSSHVWRASLNTEYLDPASPCRIPEDMRVALFGHTAAVNASYYTGAWTPEQMLAAVTRDVDKAAPRADGVSLRRRSA